MSPKLYALLISIFIWGPALAHSSIEGNVVDKASGQGIAGAVVILNASEKVAYTDANGYFKFRALAGGTYSIQSSSLGYKRVVTAVNLLENQAIKLNITLEDTAMLMEAVEISPRAATGETTLSAIDMELRQQNNTQDLLRLVPGLFIAQHAGGGKAEQIFLRGFDVDHGTDVALSVDGMPVNMVSHAHGQGYADLHFVIPELVDKVNFAKGPYDAKTGDFNTAGAVSFQTRRYLPNNFLKLEGGGFGYTRLVTGVNLLESDSGSRRQNAYVAAEYARTDGFFERSQNFNRINLLAKYNLNLGQKTDLSFSMSTFNSAWDASGQIPDRAVESGMISRFGSIDPTEGGSTSRTNINLILTKSLDGGSIITNQIHYSKYRFNLYSNFTFFLNDSINGDQIYQFEDRDIYGYKGTYTVSHHIGNREFVTTAGITLREDQINISGLSHTVARTFLNDIKKGTANQTNAAAYIEETGYLTDRLTLTLGARYDLFRFQYQDLLTNSLGNGVVKGILSPKLNLYYKLNERTQVYASAGTGFHSNDARVVTTNPAGNTLPRATGLDLGVNMKLTDKLFLNGALWALDLESEFVYVGDEAIVEPSGASRRVGIEASARWQLLDWLFADLDLNLTNPRFVNETSGQNYVPLAPIVTSVGGLKAKFRNGLGGSIRYRHLGDRSANEDNSIIAKGYTVTDLVLNYTAKHFILSLSAENLFDVRWKEAQFATETRLKGETQPVDEIHFTPGTPLFIKAGITFQY